MLLSAFDLSSPDFERAIWNIDRASTVTELQSATASLLSTYGLEHVVYHALHIQNPAITHAAVVFTYPATWVEYYLQKRLYTFDPVVRAGQREILPFDWDDLDKTSSRVKRLFDEATEAGLGRHGLSIPVRGPSGDHALFTVTVRRQMI